MACKINHLPRMNAAEGAALITQSPPSKGGDCVISARCYLNV